MYTDMIEPGITYFLSTLRKQVTFDSISTGFYIELWTDHLLSTSSAEQNGRRFVDDILKCILLAEK